MTVHEIKEELRESERVKKLIEFLEEFENGNPDEYVTRKDLIEIIRCVWEAQNQRIKNGKA
jgi:hypothetical protein